MRSNCPAVGRDVEAVAQHDLDVIAAQLLQPGAGAIGEHAKPLDGHDLAAQTRQDRGLVAGPGPDLQHPVVVA